MFCQINLFKPSNVSYKPGDTVTGAIKYAIHETMEFDTITTSLKGSGNLKIRVNRANNRDQIYKASENYVDTDTIVARNVHVPVGCHELKFSFKLPENIPPTLDYNNKKSRFKVKCRIKYYIRIKFVRPGLFTFAKHFRKDINVISDIKPHLLMEPVVYGESKKLMRLFSRKNANIAIKATILNSVIPIGGKIQVNYEIKNDTNVEIGCIETKLLEIHIFKANGRAAVIHDTEVPSTNIRTGRIDRDLTRSWPLLISVPADRVSLQNSKIVSRDYIVRITAELPMPHRNVVLDIPVQIGNLPVSDVPEYTPEPSTASPPYEDPPPSYWEAMGETPTCEEIDDDNDCSVLLEKGEKSGTL